MSLADRLKLAAATCGFLGKSPVAPGTFGTLGGVLIAWALAPLENYAVWVLAAAAAVYVLGRSLGDWAEQYAGGEDPGFFVLDEVCGYLLTIWWFEGPSLVALAVAFGAFRLFDIWKPGLVRRFDTMHGGDGIMLDDVFAGVYGLVIVMIPARLLIPDVWSLTAST